MKYGWSKSIQAPPGADGKTYYTWIKYADSPTSGMSDNPSGKAYIGIAHNKTSATESTTYSDYTWSLIKGETGADGNGITTIKQYYARTTTFSKPSAESITSTTMPELDNTYRYLWMKEVIAFTKSENHTVITLIAARGDNGEMSPEQVAQLNKASQDASAAVSKVDNLELTKIDRFGTNASMKWDGNILKIEAVDPETNVPYAVEIGGNGIEFKYDSEAVAMINQDQLVIDKTVVLTEMQVNRYWTWRTRDNNNLCLQWIGGSN